MPCIGLNGARRRNPDGRSSPGAASSSRWARCRYGLRPTGRHQPRRARGRRSRRRARRGLRFTDPWGNQFEIVEYADVQFSKAAEVLRGMGLEGLEKSESARAELAEKGLGD
jgi:hypothetical protein